ncbi:hypothetical protein ACP70R_017697 [Stipagrostis hirtigluma subsp. patula]
MLEGGEQPRWSLIVDARRCWYWIMVPQLTYGRYMLSASYDVRHISQMIQGERCVASLRTLKGQELITEEEGFNGVLTTLAYVETLETLPSIY